MSTPISSTSAPKRSCLKQPTTRKMGSRNVQFPVSDKDCKIPGNARTIISKPVELNQARINSYSHNEEWDIKKWDNENYGTEGSFKSTREYNESNSKRTKLPMLTPESQRNQEALTEEASAAKKALLNRKELPIYDAIEKKDLNSVKNQLIAIEDLRPNTSDIILEAESVWGEKDQKTKDLIEFIISRRTVRSPLSSEPLKVTVATEPKTAEKKLIFQMVLALFSYFAHMLQSMNLPFLMLSHLGMNKTHS